MKRFLGSSACVAIGLVVACGSSDDVDMASPGLSLDEARSRYPAALCDAYATCLGPLLELYLGGENCRDIAETSSSDEFERLEQLIADGKVKYDGTRAEACFDAIAAQGCSDDRDPAACVEMLDGTVAVGGDCSSNVECKGGDTYCRSAGTCPGRCAARESAGGPCSTNDDCATGLRCNREAGSCFAPARAGDRCEGGSAPQCGNAMICLGVDNDQGQPGNCRTIDEAFTRGAGQTCLVDAPLCQASQRCVIEGVDTTTGGLIANCRSPVGSGAACKPAAPDMCPVDEYCAVAPMTLDGRCTRKPGAGAACIVNGDDDPICAPGLRCDGGQCRSRQRLGGSCQEDAVCYSENCVSGSCAPNGACE